MAVADNTTWLVLGGMVLGLVLLMLFSTPVPPVADTAAADSLVASPEVVVGEAQGQASAVVHADLPVSAPTQQPMPVHAPRVGAPCDCDPAPMIPHDCPAPDPCGSDPAPIVPHRCPAPDPCDILYTRPVREIEDPCAPVEHPCDDPCTPRIRPPDRYQARACVCEPCWTRTDPEWPCDRPSCEPITTIPHPFWPEDERQCRTGNPPVPLIERTYREWAIEGERVQLHGRVSNPHYTDVCFQWSADRGTFEDATSLDPIFVVPAAERWGDSVCITLTTFDSCGGRRYDQIRLRVNPKSY
jgi:hypothetical protein